MITTNGTNEYGRKGGKFFVSINLSTTCDSFEEYQQVMSEFGNALDSRMIKEYNISKWSIPRQLQGKVHGMLNDYLVSQLPLYQQPMNQPYGGFGMGYSPGQCGTVIPPKRNRVSAKNNKEINPEKTSETITS
jgi:hypothetical protein